MRKIRLQFYSRAEKLFDEILPADEGRVLKINEPHLPEVMVIVEPLPEPDPDKPEDQPLIVLPS